MPFGSLGDPFGRLLVNFCSFGSSFWNVCWVVGFVGRFGEDLHGFVRFLTRFSAFLNNFNTFSVIFLFYCSQCTKMVGYGRIW